MKTIKLTNQIKISQKLIDLEKHIHVCYFKNETDGKIGFQFVKYNFEEMTDPLCGSKLDWIYGYLPSLEQAILVATQKYQEFHQSYAATS